MPTPTSPPDPGQTANFLNTDDVCGLVANPPGIEIAALLLAQSQDHIRVDQAADRLLESLFSPGGPMNTSGPVEISQASDTVLDFYNALLYANLIFDTESPQTDYARADEMLARLAAENPRNGIFHFMRAAVLERRGAPANEIRQVLTQSLTAPEFDAFVMFLERRIRDKSFTSASHFFLSDLLLNSMPLPHLLPATTLARAELTLDNRAFARIAVEFALRILDKPMPPATRYEFMHWNISERGVAESLLKRAWPIVYPDLPTPNFKAIPKPSQVAQKNLGDFNKAFNSLVDPKACRRDLMDRYVREAEADYHEFLKLIR